MEIKICRQKIDELDKQIVELFKKRLVICADIAKYKKGNKMCIHSPEREQEVLNNLVVNETPNFKQLIEELYRTIFSLSKLYEYAVVKNSDEG